MKLKISSIDDGLVASTLKYYIYDGQVCKVEVKDEETGGVFTTFARTKIIDSPNGEEVLLEEIEVEETSSEAYKLKDENHTN